MIQTVIVYIIIIAALVWAGIIIYRSFTHPEECAKKEGCRNCPLTADCKKAPNRKESINRRED